MTTVLPPPAALDVVAIPSQRSPERLPGRIRPDAGTKIVTRQNGSQSAAIAAAVELLAAHGHPARLAAMRLTHRDDGHGRCTACRTSDDGGPVWPCTLLGIVEAALPRALARPVLPQPPGQGRHGICVTCAIGKGCGAHPRRPRP